VPSGYQSPRVPLLKKKMCFGDSAPNNQASARRRSQEVRLPKVSACSRQTRQLLKEGFPRIIEGD
jgi:hypothetical protein